MPQPESPEIASILEKCPYQEICITVYRPEKKEYVKEVCNTPKHKSCTHYMSLQAQRIQPHSAEWERIKKYLTKKFGERNVLDK